MAGQEGNIGALNEWRRGWAVVLAAALGAAGMALSVGAVGTFVTPLSQDLGWTRGEITGALIFLGFNQVLINPIVGRWVDRAGARRVALVGAVPFALSIIALGLAGPDIWTWYLTWFVLALFYPLIGPLIWSAVIIRRFNRSRGLALGVMMCGNGFALALAPTLAVVMQQAWGWRWAYVGLGVLSFALIVPFTSWLLGREPAAGKNQAVSKPRASASGSRVAAPRAAVLRTAAFWKICVPLALGGGVVAILMIHMQPIFIDAGATPQGAAAMMGLMGPTMIIGRLATGYLLDRVAGPLVAMMALLCPVIPLVLLLDYRGSPAAGMVAAAALGMAHGAELDLLSYMTSRFFRPDHYAANYGFMLSIYSVIYTSAPMVGGVGYDLAGNYHSLILAMLGTSLLSAAIIATVGHPRADA